ncbi:MAG TPA: CU044_5270 family protein [Streptosporangiaceae bacterium]|jgi:hypothetical protein|nr:CU044_5270 family protein [Streptosporangiaceae bacterium]
MNADDSLRAREVAELARMLAVPAERDLPAGRLPIVKEHLMTELRTDQPAAHRAARAPRPRRTAWKATGIGLLAAAAAATSVIVLTGQSGGSTAGHDTAVNLLHRIALAAAQAPAPKPTDNQFMYIETEEAFGTPYGKPAPDKAHLRQVWIPVADLCKRGLGIDHGERFIISDKPTPDMVANGVHIKCPYQGSLNDPSYRLIQGLSTNPQTLLNLIYAKTKGAGQSPDQEAFTTIGDLLRESIAPPEVSAALFRAAALIPGVTVDANAVDAANRPGIGVSFTFNGQKSEWLFDKNSLQMLGELDFVNGTLTGKSAIMARAFVDHAGQVPKAG